MRKYICNCLLSICYLIIFLTRINGLFYLAYEDELSCMDMLQIIFNYPVQVFPTLVWILFLVFLWYKPINVKKNICDYIFAGMFSVNYFVGYSFYNTDSLGFITKNIYTFLLFIFCCIFFALFITDCISYAKVFVQRYKKFQMKLPECWCKYPFIFPLAFILLAWSPYIICRFPGVVEWDAFHQLLSGLGIEAINGDCPVITTMIWSRIFILLRRVTNDNNIALVGCVVVQSVICATCLAYSVYVLFKLKINNFLLYCLLFFYSINSIVPRYMTALVKDAFYSASVVLFISLMIEVIFADKIVKKDFVKRKSKFYEIRKLFLLFIASTLMTLFRDNGVYNIIPIIIVMLFQIFSAVKKDRKTVAALIDSLRNNKCVRYYGGAIIVMILAISSQNIYTNIVLPMNNIEKNSTQVIMSIPFQQTARYINKYSGEITEEEYSAIDAVLDYEVIQKEYNPRLSDPVKRTYRGNASKLKKYIEVWAVQLTKHPVVYIEAFYNNMFGFLYPEAKESASGIYDRANWDAPVVLFDKEFIQGKALLNSYITIYESLPFIGWLSNCGLHFWLFIYMFLYILKDKRNDLLLIFCPSLIGILVCFVSPTFFHNGVRYGLPIIVSNLLLVCIWMNDKHFKESRNRQENGRMY